MSLETVITLTPDGGIRVEVAKPCSACGQLKPLRSFHKKVGGRVARCMPCTERHYMQWNDDRKHWPIEDLVARKVAQANRRERFRRAVGSPLGLEEAMDKWDACEGKCENCGVEMTFEWTPRQENADHAVIDRVDTSKNATYAGNMAWLCTWCNTEKGGWDLVAQRDEQIARLKKKLKKFKRSKTIDYSSVLIPSCPPPSLPSSSKRARR